MPSAEAGRIAFASVRKEALAATRAEKETNYKGADESEWQEVVPDGGGFVVRSSATDPEAWTESNWRDAFEQMFVTGMEEMVHAEHADDLLFFVRKEEAQDPSANRGPLFVRRKGQAMPADCVGGGPEAGSVDWCRSVVLNTVLQTPFYLTVSACSKEHLSGVLEFDEGGPCVTKVTKHVFASPTRVSVNLDSSRAAAAEPAVSYPDMCFSVDNFDEAFDSLMLGEADECYSVCLWAHRLTAAPEPGMRPAPGISCEAGGGDTADTSGQHTADSGAGRDASGGATAAAADVSDGAEAAVAQLADAVAGVALDDGGGGAHEAAGERQHADTAHPLLPGEPAAAAKGPAVVDAAAGSCVGAAGGGAAAGPGSGRVGEAEDRPSILLFSGYVSFQQLQGVVDTTGLHPLRLWGRAGDSTYRVIMRGPGGIGHADVAVTVCSSPKDAPDAVSPTSVPDLDGGSPPGAVQLRNSFFGKAVSRAVKLAGAAAKAAQEMAHEQRPDVKPSPVRCALMTLVLPVNEIAQRVLKGS